MSAHLAILSSGFTCSLKPCQASPGRADKIFLEPSPCPTQDSIISSVASLFPHHNLLEDMKYVLISFVSFVLSTISDTEKMLRKTVSFSQYGNYYALSLELDEIPILKRYDVHSQRSSNLAPCMYPAEDVTRFQKLLCAHRTLLRKENS